MQYKHFDILLQQMRSFIRVTTKHIVHKLVKEEEKQVELLSSPAKILDRKCYEEAVAHFKEHCFNFSKVKIF